MQQRTHVPIHARHGFSGGCLIWILLSALSSRDLFFLFSLYQSVVVVVVVLSFYFRERKGLGGIQEETRSSYGHFYLFFLFSNNCTNTKTQETGTGGTNQKRRKKGVDGFCSCILFFLFFSLLCIALRSFSSSSSSHKRTHQCLTCFLTHIPPFVVLLSSSIPIRSVISVTHVWPLVHCLGTQCVLVRYQSFLPVSRCFAI